MKSDELKLKEVSLNDAQFLFDLLKERDPKANISHKKMPTFTEHKKFLNSKPYSKWYIIKLQNHKVGSIYLTHQDEIGIFINKKFQSKNIGQKALLLLFKKNPRKRYLANVNPKNSKSIKFFKNNGFTLLQYTFELDLS